MFHPAPRHESEIEETSPFGRMGRLELRAHRDRLLRSALLVCRNQAEAEDLVQETFLQAITLARRFRGDSTIHTWLHGILLNLHHRALREQKRLVLDEQLVRNTMAPEEPAASDELFVTASLADAMQRLSPEHREVIELRYYSNLKIHEIAERTRICEGTIKSRLYYALRCLERFVPNG